ncbi:MAG: hypothetical protein ACLP59_04860 [Bryobacteraceae bacterium]
MAYIPITAVRYNRKLGKDVLQTFLFGGRYGGIRVPRGVPPELVSEFIGEQVQPDTPPPVYSKVAAVLRFYERPDVLPHLKLALTGKAANLDDVLRAAFVIQSIGDLGTPAEGAQAAAYLDSVLVPQPLALNAFSVLFEALIAVAPAGSPQHLVERLGVVVYQAEQNQRTERGVQDYQRIASVQRNDRPRYQIRWDAKSRLARQAPAERRAELLKIYLRQSPLSDTQMEEWAARMLRAEAMHGDPQPVYAAFGQALDAADPKKMGPQRATFEIVRAAQAILYLQGKLSSRQEDLYDAAGKTAMNFLWDDLPG